MKRKWIRKLKGKGVVETPSINFELFLQLSVAQSKRKEIARHFMKNKT